MSKARDRFRASVAAAFDAALRAKRGEVETAEAKQARDREADAAAAELIDEVLGSIESGGES